MTLFEQLKNFPKVDLHINLTSSISTNLAFDLTNESIQDLEDKMIGKNARDYLNCLKVPIQILKTKKNTELAVNDLIDRLINNNVIYSELFLDLPLYNKRIDEEKILNIILDTIKKREYNMQVVLCLSSNNTKEENLFTLSLLDKYYLKGVNGVYFQKDKMINIEDYTYVFDRLIKSNIPYILMVDFKITNQNKDIYYHAKRLIYALRENNELMLNSFKEHDIMLEFPITSFENDNIIINLKDYFLYDLYKDNYLMTIVSRDMTILNTDILNEYCLIFNNCPITMHDLVKINVNSLMNINIDENKRALLVEDFKEKSNLIL